MTAFSRSRRKGRRSWFSVAEPLFRFWSESRAAPWSRTRVGALTRWIEAISTLNGTLSGPAARLDPRLRFDPVGAQRALEHQIDQAGASALHPEVQHLVDLLRPATG